MEFVPPAAMLATASKLGYWIADSVGAVLFMIGQLWLRRWLDVFVARTENGFVVQLRAQLYEAMVHADLLFFTRQRGSEITQVLIDEVERIGSGTQRMLGLLSTAGVGLVQLAFVFLLAPGLTALAICCGGVLLLANRPVTRRAEELDEEAQEKRLQMTSAITEHLGGMKVAKSQGREGGHLAHFYSVINDIAAHTVELLRVWAGSRARYEIGAVLALEGEIVEHGTWQSLLLRPGSLFAGMVQAGASSRKDEIRMTRLRQGYGAAGEGRRNDFWHVLEANSLKVVQTG